ncbi:hypothetical protein GYA27_00785 [candidate division WWE3 bacterium]|uniref:Uncharacterized protein n=1 Tax=candidate division WWE3 bacterium TaxID=2053526 RepID=A0A7X9DJQ5_UNCKA|nr:hypothetical protein [candidate division WWE3 bacterium]
MKKILLAIFTLALVFGIVFYILSSQNPKSKSVDKTGLIDEQTSSTIDTETDPATTMDNYSDENLGFAIEYPANWTFEKQGDYFVRMMPKLKKPATSETNFIQIQIVPKKINVSDSLIYGFNGENFRKLLNNTNQKFSISEDAGMREYFTYEKQPDIKLSGFTANVYINKKPWEFPSGTTEYKYIFNVTNKYVILNAFLGSDTKDQFYISRESFQRILNTLEITDKDNLGEFGTITGKLCFPSERLPEGVIQALNLANKNMYEYIYPGSGNGGKSTYELNVVPGEYVLRYKTNEMEGYHTNVCPTGMETSCNAANQRKNISVNVENTEVIKNIDLCDFYYNSDTKPEF